MDEQFEQNLVALAESAEKLAALLPEEPASELELAAAEFVALAAQHLALVEGMFAEEPPAMGDDVEEEMAE
jgi:hypothetical protein